MRRHIWLDGVVGSYGTLLYVECGEEAFKIAGVVGSYEAAKDYPSWVG